MQLNAIRHLPTEWNKQGILQGKRDISICDITPKIAQQIIINKQILEENGPYDIVLTSTLRRTFETASIYGFNNWIKEPLADELDFGKFEGESKTSLHNLESWLDNPSVVKLGEDLSQFERRLFTFLDKYQKFPKILLFGHGSWIRGMSSIKEFGVISQMNKLEVPNNVLFQFTFTVDELDEIKSRK